MLERAIVHTEMISRKGELKYFQIPLPGKTKKIIAVEASAFLTSPTGSAQQAIMVVMSAAYDETIEGGGGGGNGGGEEPPPPPPPPPPPRVGLVEHDILFTIHRSEKVGMLSLQSPDVTDIFLQTEVFRTDNNINFGDFTYDNLLIGEWIKGKKRIATEFLITTGSPILEAYYKDTWGAYHGEDLNYQLNIFIWIEKDEYDK